MPKRVDPISRRAEIIDAYLRLVARSGIASATSRAIAVEAGISAGALWHYFDGLDDVLRGAFERVYQRTNERIDVAAGGRRGLSAVHAMAVEIIPHDAQTREEAAIVVSFWGLLPAHDAFQAHARAVERDWSARVARHLQEAVDDGELVPATPIAVLTPALLAVFETAQLRQVQGSAASTAAAGHALLAHLCDPWRPG